MLLYGSRRSTHYRRATAAVQSNARRTAGRLALAWAAACPGGPVISVRALRGGMSSAVHLPQSRTTAGSGGRRCCAATSGRTGLLPGLPRTTAGYRDYPDQAPVRLAFIRAAESAGLTLAGIRGILAVRDHGRPPCTHVTAVLRRRLAETERRLAGLAQARAMLGDLLATAQATDPGTSTGSICTILDPPGPRT